MEALLPDYCYRDSHLTPKGIVIHYFSCINVQPGDPFNQQDCWLLMHDLNAAPDKRMKFLRTDQTKRYYASAHSLIGRDGKEMITVPENKQAYHAGASHYRGRANWNQNSYGIELIGSATSGFTDKQYHACAMRCKALMDEYSFTTDWVVGHEDVSPGRKVDPGIATGNFDMERLKELILNL